MMHASPSNWSPSDDHRFNTEGTKIAVSSAKLTFMAVHDTPLLRPSINAAILWGSIRSLLNLEGTKIAVSKIQT